jgi:hypothetical protein
MATSKGAHANATASGTNPTKGAFILNDNELAALASARGRKATDSEYLAQMRDAVDNPTVFVDGQVTQGEIHGIDLTESLKAAWVGPQLRKAAKQLGCGDRITVLDRSGSVSDDHPFGFMAYWIKPESTDDSVTDSE